MQQQYKELTDRTHNLAQLMMKSTSGILKLFTVVGVFDDETNEGLAVTTGWAGEEKEGSRAPIVARYKAAQVLTAPRGRTFVLSPTWYLDMGPDFDFPGGVMKLVDNQRFVAACSAQSAQTDLLVASTLVYAMQYEVRFNHFGITYSSQDELERAIIVHEGLYATQGINSTFGEGESFHHRCYIPVEDKEAPNGVWFIELRWFPNRKTISPEFHFDLITSAPHQLLEFLAVCQNSKAEIWDDADPGTPVGMVSVPNGDKQVALMARDRWFDPR